MIRTLLAFILAAIALPAMAAEVPRLASANGRHALIVDGKPFLMLGVQANNSSNYPAMLPLVWPMIERLHANTLEMPIAWEQVERQEGRFDFSFVDLLLEQAREKDIRLVLLWFGSWKNGNGQYLPEWVKTDPARFPRKRDKDGSSHFALTPHSRANLEADKRAFTALMRHLRARDPQHIVIMVQPQNEVGNWNNPRDYAPAATRLFEGQVPAVFAAKLGKRPGTWTQVFGKTAEQAFSTYHYARYIDEIAAAGKAELPLPMYCNASLSDPFTAEPDGNAVPSGGPNWNVIALWRAAAPNIDLVAPDIYTRDWKSYIAYLDHYTRPDNALMVPETGHAIDFARFFWPVLGRGAIGFAPFGIDGDDYTNYPLGAKTLDDATVEAFAANYRLFRPMANAWAKIAFENPTWGAAKGPDATDQSTVMGRWKVTVSFEQWQFGDRDSPWLKPDPHPTRGLPLGGGVVAQIGADEFLIAGAHIRFAFGLAKPGAGEQSHYLRVEQGSFDAAGKWAMRNVWNGDQADYGLNFTARPVMLRVRLGELEMTGDRLVEGGRIETLEIARGPFRAQFLNLGAALRTLEAPDRNGKSANVTLGYQDVEEYRGHPRFYGAVAGRYANRIGGAKFSLDGREFHLPKNNGANNLHSGPLGFDQCFWEVEKATSDSVHFSLLSPDGNNGFPGTLHVDLIYTLEEDGLAVHFSATTDAPTVINLTHHAYFNLAGEVSGQSILDQWLQIPASRFTPTEDQIPTGVLQEVAGGAFDFRAPKAIGRDIGVDDEQLKRGLGYDHNFVLDSAAGAIRRIATAWDPGSGRVLEVHSDQPGVQLYSGNHLANGAPGTSGGTYKAREGFCLEPQKFPDTPNKPQFGSARLDPGQRYVHDMAFRFRTAADEAEAFPA